MNVSHVVLTDKPGDGLLLKRNKGRPTNEEQKKMDCPKETRVKINEMRKRLGYKKGTEIVLMVSISTDEMARQVHMFPECWFLDCSSNTNREKRDLFLLVVKTATGKCVPGNITFIPSGEKWVFQCIYADIFILLFGENTISRNRLAITDEDAAEFFPFDNVIRTMVIYSGANHMLCTFHAIWKPFKERIFPTLPKKNGRLTKDGERMGKSFIKNIYSYELIL